MIIRTDIMAMRSRSKFKKMSDLLKQKQEEIAENLQKKTQSLEEHNQNAMTKVLV